MKFHTWWDRISYKIWKFQENHARSGHFYLAHQNSSQFWQPIYPFKIMYSPIVFCQWELYSPIVLNHHCVYIYNLMRVDTHIFWHYGLNVLKISRWFKQYVGIWLRSWNIVRSCIRTGRNGGLQSQNTVDLSRIPKLVPQFWISCDNLCFKRSGNNLWWLNIITGNMPIQENSHELDECWAIGVPI